MIRLWESKSDLGGKEKMNEAVCICVARIYLHNNSNIVYKFLLGHLNYAVYHGRIAGAWVLCAGCASFIFLPFCLHRLPCAWVTFHKSIVIYYIVSFTIIKTCKGTSSPGYLLTQQSSLHHTNLIDHISSNFATSSNPLKTSPLQQSLLFRI